MRLEEREVGLGTGWAKSNIAVSATVLHVSHLRWFKMPTGRQRRGLVRSSAGERP